MRNRFSNLTDSVIAQSLLLVVTTRLFLFGVNWYSLKVMPPDWDEHSRLIGGWARWDAGHYIRIAMNGYAHDSDPGSPAFFPLFPLMMRTILEVLQLDLNVTNLGGISILIAAVCFFLAVSLFAVLVERRFGREVAITSTLLLCLSPFSLFFNAGYTESLFLLLTVLVFSCADRRLWIAAALFVALATATRVTGLALAPSLLLLAWKQGASRKDLFGIVLLSPLGLLAYMAHLWHVLGDPLAFLKAQRDWGGWEDRAGRYLELFLTRPEEVLTGDPVNAVVLLNVALMLIWLASLPWVWRMLDPGIALFTILIVMQGLTSWVSLGRYLLPAIGFYMVASVLFTKPSWRRVPREAAIIVSTMLLTMLTILFAHGHWVI